jgi:hypothetical protein
VALEALSSRPRRPILTLAGLRPREPEPAPPAPTPPQQAPEPPQEPLRTRPKRLRPVKATDLMLMHAQALQGLLTRPIAVLPQQPGDQVLPFKVGLGQDLLPLLREGVEPKRLTRALQAYVKSGGYLLASSKEGALRHDLDGNPVEEVSQDHRQGAAWLIKARQAKREPVPKTSTA